MCLALPARVAALNGADQAVVELGGVRKEVSIALTPEAQVGDYVLVHVGFAISKIDEAQANDIWEALETMGELAGAESPTKADAP
jgi:hydrogenase expression/formation protein HypC